MTKRKEPEGRFCEECGAFFAAVDVRKRFCSQRCRTRSKGRRHYARAADGINARLRERYRTDPVFHREMRARQAGKKAQWKRRQPCERCGGKRAERHHDDYRKPEQIRWLCRACHIGHHVAERGSWGAGLRRHRATASGSGTPTRS